MKLMKRTLALILCFVMCLSFFPAPSSYAQENDETAQVSVASQEGTNSVGMLLSNSIESQNAAENEDGNHIISVEFEAGSAVVRFETDREAEIVAAVYSNDGLEMLTSGNEIVSPEASETHISLNENVVPDYFILAAYMLDVNDHTPLCEEMINSLHSKQAQDLLNSSINDYDPDLVLNLDEDPTTNFLVFSEDTVVAQRDSGFNQVISLGDGNYLISNADESVRALQPGNSFACRLQDGSVLAIVVSSIRIEGENVILSEKTDAELEDVFDYVKIEMDSTGASVSVDETSAAPGVNYLGEGDINTSSVYDQSLSAEGLSDSGMRGSVEGSFSKSLSWDLTIGETGGGGPLTGSISGAVSYKFTVSVKAYISPGWKYIDFSMSQEFSGSVTYSGKLKLEIPLGLVEVGFPTPIPLIEISFIPYFVAEAEAALTLEISLSASTGFIYDSDVGWQNKSINPKVDVSAELEGSLFFGLQLEPSISLISRKLASGVLKIKLGVEFSAKPDVGGVLSDLESEPDTIHDCNLCFDGEVKGKLSLSVELKLLDKVSDKLKANLASLSIELGRFYFSLTYGEFDWTRCPHKTYRVTMTIRDKVNRCLTGAEIMGTGLDPAPVTDDKGRAVFYLREGEYQLSFESAGTEHIKNITVPDSERDIVVILNYIPNGVVDTSLPASGEWGGIHWDWDGERVLTLSGDGDMQEDAAPVEYPWKAYYSAAKTLVVEDGITSIAENAFSPFINLTSVSLADSVSVIKEAAFDGCLSLTEITLPTYLSELGKGAFNQCTSLKAVTLPSYLKVIPEYAFSECYNLRSVTIGTSVTQISIKAFFSCTNLKDVFYKGYENNWNSIDIKAGNESLLAAKLHYAVSYSGVFGDGLLWYIEGNSKLVISGEGEIPDYNFYPVPVYTYEKSYPPWYDYKYRIKSIEVEEGITRIGDSAFKQLSYVENISLPNGLLSIGDQAIRCEKLTEITIPNSVTEIDSYAFYYDKALKKVKLPANLTVIQYDTFNGCESLEEITLPSTLKEIGRDAFRDCKNLRSIVLPEGFQRLTEGAFEDCVSLEHVVIPETCTSFVLMSMYNGAFYGCSLLTSAGPIGSGCAIEYGWKDAIPGEALRCAPITELYFPAGLSHIGEYAFVGCDIQVLNLPEGLTSIDRYAFMGCQALTDIHFPSSLDYIGYEVFAGCRSLTMVQIPKTVKTVYADAFESCTGLSVIQFNHDADSELNIYATAFQIDDYDPVVATTVIVPDLDSINPAITNYNWEGANRTVRYSQGSVSTASLAETAEEPEEQETTNENEIIPAPVEDNTEPPESILTDDPEPGKEEEFQNSIEPDLQPGEIEDESADGETLLPEEPFEDETEDQALQPDATIPDLVASDVALFRGTQYSGGRKTTAHMDGLAPGKEYVFLVVRSLADSILFDSDNLLFIGQRAASANGTLDFDYVLPTDAGSVTAVAFGPEDLSWLKNYTGDVIWFEQNYLLMKENETATLFLRAADASLLKHVIWSVLDEQGNSIKDASVTISDNGTVTAVTPGIAFVSARIDADGIHGEALCRIDVVVNEDGSATPITDELEVLGVTLITKKTAVNLFSTKYTPVNVTLEIGQNQPGTAAADDGVSIPDKTGKAIQEAVFTDSITAAVFDLRIKDDRTLEIVPKSEFVFGDAEKLKTVKSKYQSAITVTVEGEQYTTSNSVVFSVSQKQPGIKAKNVKLNSYLPGCSKPLAFTGGTVTAVSAEQALPTWLSLDKEAFTLIYSTDWMYQGAKYGNTKIKLSASVDGWALPRPVTLTVSAAPTVPKLKAKPATLTLKPGTDDSASAFITVSPADFAATPVSIAWIAEPKAHAYYINDPTSDSYDPYYFGEGDNAIPLICSYENNALTVSVKEGFDDSVKRTFKVYLRTMGRDTAVTVNTIPLKTEVKLSVKSTGAIDTAIAKSPLKLTVTAKNIHADAVTLDRQQVTIYQQKSSKRTVADLDVTSLFDISVDGLQLTLTEKEQGSLEKGYLYYADITASLGRSAQKSVTVKLNVKWSPENKVPVSINLKNKGTIDVIRPETSVTVVPIIKNWNLYSPIAEDLHFYRKNGKQYEEVPDLFTAERNEDGSFSVSALAGVSPKDKYYVRMETDIQKSASEDGTLIPGVSSGYTAFKVKMGSAKITQSTKAVQLLKRDCYSRARVKLAFADTSLSEISSVVINSPTKPVYVYNDITGKTEKTTVPLFDLIDLGHGECILHYYGNEVTTAKASSVKLLVFLEGNTTGKPNATVTVKINIV